MREIEVKSIIGKNNTINLYRGCSHGCIYCDSRSDCYNVGDFESIAVKKDALKILEKELKSKRKKSILHTGSMCDPYIHLEKELQITKGMLELIYKYQFGITILTKSTLILRDINLYEEINKIAPVKVFMTITTFDDFLSKKIERNVSCTSERFKCLQEFNKKGIPIGIWLTPILPFINDDVENLINIIDNCHLIGVKYIVLFQFGTTKRKGSEEHFYSSLDKYFPGIRVKYENYFNNIYDCISPNALELWKVFKAKCDYYNIIYDVNKIFNIPLKRSE